LDTTDGLGFGAHRRAGGEKEMTYVPAGFMLALFLLMVAVAILADYWLKHGT
jgi:hypothetical protein